MKYQKGSFIIIPNKQILDTLSLGALGIYVHLCDFADHDGVCFPSRATLAKRIGMHVNSVDRFLNELIEKGLLEKVSRHRKDGSITSNEYQIMVVPLTTHSDTPITTHSEAELYPLLTQSIYTSEPEVRMEYVSEKEPRPKADTSYRQVFCLWGKYPLQWNSNRAEIQAAKNLLEETTLDQMKKALAIYEKHKDHQFCPSILKPTDLDRKWDNLVAFKKKYG